MCCYKPKLNNWMGYLYTNHFSVTEHYVWDILCMSRYYFNYIFTCTDFKTKSSTRSIKYNIKNKYIFYSRYHLKIFSLLFSDLSECLLSKSNNHQNNLGEFSGKPDLPYFDKAASKNVTSPLGKTAYLNCRVKNLANRTVSKQNIF